jgi:hypothetical protein
MLRNTIIIFIMLLKFSFNTIGQSEKDTCQCQLLYGNWAEAVLVTYHHDSLVTYARSIFLKEHLFKLLKDLSNRDTIFGISDYNWFPNTRTYTIRKGEVGNKLGAIFFNEFPNEIIDSGTTLKSFWLTKPDKTDSLLGYSKEILLSHERFYETPIKINGILSSCYKYSDPYVFTGDFNKLDISHEYLLGLPYYETWNDVVDSPSFVVKESICEMTIDNYKTCYLPGIGEFEISVDYDKPFPENISRKIIYLTPQCNKYLFENFGFEKSD